MNRLSTLLLCASVFLLPGCPRHATLSEAAEQPLTPTYTEDLPGTAKFLEFSNKGNTFIVSGEYDFLYFYDALTLEKRMEVTKNPDKILFFSVRGAGYIDNNTWYFATDEFKDHCSPRNTSVNIWQIEPLREIHKYPWDGLSGRPPVLANRNHIVHREKMLNWHDGRVYDLSIGHLDYMLTPDSQVVTSHHYSGLYQFYDPFKQESTFWDIGSDWLSQDLTLSPDASYALITSSKGRCELWRVPEKEELGRCGRNRLFGGTKWQKIAFQRDSQMFAFAAGNETISVYATQPFKPLMSVTMPNEVQALALNEGQLAAVDKSGTVRVWDVEANKLLGEYTNNSAFLATFSIALQPGGSKLVVTQFDKTLQQAQLMVFDLDAARFGGISAISSTTAKNVHE